MTKPFNSMIWDYLVFAIFLVISTLYPLWGETIGNKTKKTKANYVFATGRVSMFAMMLSIARGTLGVRAFLGFPSELFYRGSGMWETLYGLVTAYPIVSMVMVPVYCNLGITSVYQYLDLRFKSKLVRCLASASFVIRNVFTLGITVYTPCVALNTVVGVPYWASLLTMTAISILFTLLGGLKAAITADVIQGVTMILVSVGIIIQGAYETGGVDKVYKINRDNERLDFFTFSGGVTARVDTVSAWVGQLFISLSVLGCQQSLVQRYLSMKDVKEVRQTLTANIPFIVVLFSLAWIVGMGVYSTYVQCDPMGAGYIKKMDEILPFFVEDKLSYIPGFLGIFMATLFNGALCLNVSNLNSLATVTWEDFLSPLPRFKDMIDKQQLHIIKFLGVIYAIIILGVAFSVGFLSGVIEAAMLTSSATAGPLVGVFLLAMLVPIANWKGAASGMIASHIIVIVITFGSFTIQKPDDKLLNLTTDGCTNNTFSPWITKSETSWLIQNSPVEIGWNNNDDNAFIMTTPKPVITERTFTESIFSITYMYYSFLGTFITMSVGVLVSWATSSKEDKEYDENLLHPVIIKMRRFFRNRKLQNSNDDEGTNSNQNNSIEFSNKNVAQHINHGFENETSCTRTKRSNKNNAQDIADINRISIEFEDIDLSNNNSLASPPPSSSSSSSSSSQRTITAANSDETPTTLSKINRLYMKPTETYRRISEPDL